MTKKRRTKCGVVKPLTAFNWQKANSDGYHSNCKECRAEYSRKRNMRPEIKKRNQKHNTRPEVKVRTRKYYAQPKIKAQRCKRFQEQKLAAFNRLDGACCALCGCEETCFLTIDYVDNNGAEYRRLLRSKINLWVVNATDTELRRWNLRVLCFNCNCAQYFSDNDICAAVAREHVRIRITIKTTEDKL